MELVGVISSVLIVVSLVEQGLNVVSKIVRVSGDARFEGAKWELWAEKKAFEGWANNMRRNNESVPEEDRENIQQMIYAMSLALEKLEHRMSMFEPIGGGLDAPKSRALTMGKRIAWLRSGKEDVQELLRLVKALNKALNIAAPPLPVYTRYPVTSTDVLQSSTPQAQAASASQLPSMPAGESSSQVESVADSVEHQDVISVWQLFNECLRCTSDMIRCSTKPHKLLIRTKDRLSLWCQGLFNNALGLEVILANKNKDTNQILETLLSCLVDIAYTEEQILVRWIESEQSFDRNRMENVKNTLTSALAQEQVTLLTLQRWKLNIIENEEFGPKSDEEDLEFVDSVVDLLFDILPAIRSIRREEVLRSESESDRLHLHGRIDIASVGTQTEVEASASENATVNLIEANLQQAKDLEREIQSMHQLTTASARLANEIKRLEQWRLDALDNPKIAVEAHSNPEVIKRQEVLASEFAKVFKPSVNAQVAPAMSEKSRLELTPETCGHIVETISYTTRHLTVASGTR